MDYNIEIIKSERKTVALEVKKDLRVIVRAPLWMKHSDIERFVEGRFDWIKKHMEVAKQRLAEQKPKFTQQEIAQLRNRAQKIIPPRVEYYASLIGVDYGTITVRSQISRWGSCSSNGNLNFNCLLTLCPPEVLDYVVVHELCHRKQMNHSTKFWAEVSAALPEYERQKIWLKDNGAELVERL